MSDDYQRFFILDSRFAHFVQFHISRKARRKYAFDEHLFSSTGNVIFANFHAARLFAEKMNARRDVATHPEQVVRASQINAMGLIDELLHKVVALYRQQVNPRIFQHAIDFLAAEYGQRRVEKTLLRFVEEFPPLEVYKNKVAAQDYLSGSTGGVPNRQIALEEMLMLWLENLNPAFQPFHELFDDGELRRDSAYASLMVSLEEFFKKEPGFGVGKLDLISLLRQPALAKPHSLEEQLLFIRQMWGHFLGDYLLRLLGSLDFLKEEQKAVFHGPAPTQVAAFEQSEFEPEQFSPDLHWMPRLVLIAKSTLVWLEQLSKTYQRAITRLSDIPDEELDKLARWGFTGLWLIGVWERSPASKQIKRLCGNPEAESSAYSLFDYEVAHELGGYDALMDLKHRCGQRGMRLACDMVPNHTGIDSRWIREHPDWFISLPYSPFPAYSFSGSNLSGDPRYGIFIEDKYYNRSDAAVVFKREDYWTGDVRYIYHGNDGTNMPWNDTAQLNYLLPEVREAVIQKILDVARMFPVIRFDAAMTLAKKHFQRLWFPQPGTGGDIPSRAEHGLTKEEFNRRMPVEFWREVVDRVALEVPDTLLLAEAFWLMEGYFVRTLGMHRVYNSAFMNMLKNEENEKYRQTVINTIQFNPEILKRYVNFMNNPDEDTAIVQFGDGDKYFGVCLMLVTMPGLPMFGHGQVEGFHEKYGMEYRRAYWDEPVNEGLVHRHEREIFPLMQKRYLFAEVDNFLFYDFVVSGDQVNHNVFVYSNRFADERAIVVYHNKFEHTAGWINRSVPSMQTNGTAAEGRLVSKTLSQGLALPGDADAFCIFRDYISGLQFIRNCKEIAERGLYFELNAYGRHVFLDFEVIHDDKEQHYARLHRHLNGRGVGSIHEEVREMALRPLLEPLDALLNTRVFRRFFASRSVKKGQTVDKQGLQDICGLYQVFIDAAAQYVAAKTNSERLGARFCRRCETALNLLSLPRTAGQNKIRNYAPAMRFLHGFFDGTEKRWAILFPWIVLCDLGKLEQVPGEEQRARSRYDDWLLRKRVKQLLTATGSDAVDEDADLLAVLLRAGNTLFRGLAGRQQAGLILEDLLSLPDVQSFLKINRYGDVLWFNKERFEMLTKWLVAVCALHIWTQKQPPKAEKMRQIADLFALYKKWCAAEEKSGYKVTLLLEVLGAGPRPKLPAAVTTRAPRKGWVAKK